MIRYTVLAAALVLTSMGAAGAQEAPLSERVRNTLEAEKRTLEERTEHYKKRREEIAARLTSMAERVRNTLEAEKRTLEERTEHYKKRREEIAARLTSMGAAGLAEPREGPEDEISRIMAARSRAAATRTRVVAKGHFYCGKTFITVPIDESLLVTIRKAHISGLLWDQKNDEFELVAEPKDQKPFHVYVDGRAFLRLVTECLD